MSPKVDQNRGAVFSVNNNQASNSHSLSTQCIWNTSSCNVNERQHTITSYGDQLREQDVMFPYVFHFRGFTLRIDFTLISASKTATDDVTH